MTQGGCAFVWHALWPERKGEKGVGWIERFKRRHGTALKTVSGDAAAVDHTVIKAWKQHDLPSLLNEYGEDDIFNADETGIFYKCLPDSRLP